MYREIRFWSLPVVFFSCMAKKTAGRALAVWRFITSGEYRDIAWSVRPQANRRPSSASQDKLENNSFLEII